MRESIESVIFCTGSIISGEGRKTEQVVSIKKYRNTGTNGSKASSKKRCQLSETFIDLNVVFITIQASLEFLTLILQKIHTQACPTML